MFDLLLKWLGLAPNTNVKTKRKKYTRITPEISKQIIDMYLSKVDINTIVDNVDISRTSVYRIIREYKQAN